MHRREKKRRRRLILGFGDTHLCYGTLHTCCTVGSAASYILSVSHKQTSLACLPNTVTAAETEAISLTCLKCKWTCLRKSKKNLPACLWEGGVLDNTKNIKYEEVQKQTLCVLQMCSWGLGRFLLTSCLNVSCKVASAK